MVLYLLVSSIVSTPVTALTNEVNGGLPQCTSSGFTAPVRSPGALLNGNLIRFARNILRMIAFVF